VTQTAASAPNISITFVAKPWWSRFYRAIELAVFGSIVLEGKIAEISEDGRPLQ
jgi:hypothetical protein